MKPLTLAERVAVLETDVANIKTDQQAAITAHTALSEKIDKLANKLLAATCVITGVVIGAKIINIEHLEKLRALIP